MGCHFQLSTHYPSLYCFLLVHNKHPHMNLPDYWLLSTLLALCQQYYRQATTAEKLVNTTHIDYPASWPEFTYETEVKNDSLAFLSTRF